ncbi:hypothetical protein SIO70_27510 [Chitinophaga sancti]|uniref:hypothetical protein n=1 Tax=Chitinophaga sancti TaxID=1004 RepID=UPI002A756EC9|nr:hypothetical protein [Chitinophaga sancti]WPQ62115.1 hypothetical protein SIO70_27510 [Chitinophaga sancti]
MKYLLKQKSNFLLYCIVMILSNLPLYAQLTQRVITITQPSMDIPELAKAIAAQTGVEYSLNMQNTSLKKSVHLKAGKWKLEDVMREVQQQVGLEYRILGDHILFTDYKPGKKVDGGQGGKYTAKGTSREVLSVAVKREAGGKQSESGAVKRGVVVAKNELGAVKKRTVAGKNKSGAAKRGVVVAKSELGAVKKGTVAGKNESGAVKRGAVATQSELGAVKKGTIVAKNESGASKKETVVTKEESIATKSVLIPAESSMVPAYPAYVLSPVHADYNITPSPVAPNVKPRHMIINDRKVSDTKEASRKKEKRHIVLPHLWAPLLAEAGFTANDIVYGSASVKAGIQYFYGIATLGVASRGMRFRYGAGIRFPLDEYTALHAEFTTGALSRKSIDTVPQGGLLRERMNSYGVSWSKTIRPRLNLQVEVNYSTLKKSNDSTVNKLNMETHYYGYGTPVYNAKIGGNGNYYELNTWIGVRVSLFYNLRRK